jgi:hypothetical protein
LDLLNENEQLPHALAVSERRIFHNGRERIRVREIHQMNYFDDHVCLPRMSILRFTFAHGTDS